MDLICTSQSFWLSFMNFIRALVNLWFVLSSRALDCGWYAELILWSVSHNWNSSSLTLLTTSRPWSDIAISAINICLLERVNFKPSLNLTQASIKKKKLSIFSNFATVCKKKKKNSLGFVKIVANFLYLSQATVKKIHSTELPLDGFFRAPIQKQTCWITVLDRLTMNTVNNYKNKWSLHISTPQSLSDITCLQPICF